MAEGGRSQLPDVPFGQAIEQLMNQKQTPVRLAYDLQKRVDGIERALETYTKTRDKLIKQYGKPSPMGGFQIDPKNEKGTASFVKEHDELLAIEVEIEYKRIKLSELEKNGIELSPAELKAIMWLLEVGPEEDGRVPDDQPLSIGEGT